jgi:hypothetical protein
MKDRPPNPVLQPTGPAAGDRAGQRCCGRRPFEGPGVGKFVIDAATGLVVVLILAAVAFG